MLYIWGFKQETELLLQKPREYSKTISAYDTKVESQMTIY